MKNLILCLCILFMISCKTDNSKTETAMLSMVIEVPKTSCSMNRFNGPVVEHPHPYELNLNLNSLENNVYDLEMAMVLINGAHFVSPNSKGNFKGIFTVFIEKNNHIERTTELLETPLSIEEYDSHSYVNGYVNWVRENTTYRQQIKRTSEDAFEVMGYIQFTIEPKCTLENIPFIIKFKDEELKFEIFGC